MERYIKLQTLHTATLNALTVDSKMFDVDAAVRDQGLADSDLSEFNKNVAEAVAGELRKCKWIIIYYNVQFTSRAEPLTVCSCNAV